MDDGTAGWVAPIPRRRGDRLRSLAPALLLLVVALVGVRNNVVRDQSSWQGASFGMFATYENGVSRTVIVTVEEDGDTKRVALPADLEDDAERLAVVPSRGAARSLAESVLAKLDTPAPVHVEVRALDLDDDGGLQARLRTLVQETATP